jgi:hypothetical protein
MQAEAKSSIVFLGNTIPPSPPSTWFDRKGINWRPQGCHNIIVYYHIVTWGKQSM